MEYSGVIRVYILDSVKKNLYSKFLI